MSAAVSASGLAKRFGSRDALTGVDLDVAPGTIAGLLGPNGAGKTTFLKLLLGLQHPSSGSASVLGLDAVRQSLAVRRAAAAVPQSREIFGRMRVRTLLAATAAAAATWDAATEARLIARWEILPGARLRELSPGMRGRVLLVAALARRPRVLLLDEVTAGLDPAGVDDTLTEVTSAAADGTTVLLATHRLEEVERICDHVVVLDHGSVTLAGDLDDLRAEWRAIEAARHPPAARIAEWGEVERVTVQGDVARLIVRRDPDVVIGRLDLFGAEVVGSRPLSLREIYFAVTGRGDE